MPFSMGKPKLCDHQKEKNNNVTKEKNNIKWYIHNKSNHVKLCIRTWVRREHGKLKTVMLYL